MLQYPLIDVARLEEFMAFLSKPNQPFTAAELARKSKIPEGTLSKILSKRQATVAPFTLTRLASAIGVPAIALSPFEMRWWWTSQLDRPQLDELFDCLGHAHELLSLSRDFGSHLLPFDLHCHLERTKLPQHYRDPELLRKRLDYTKVLWHQRRQARSHCSYTLKLIAPETALQLAANTNVGWLSAICDGIKEHWESTAVGILNDESWARVDDWVKNQLLEENWVKINVADTILACVYTYANVVFTYDRTKVVELKNLIEGKCAEELTGPFPTKKPTTTIMRSTAQYALKYIRSHFVPENQQHYFSTEIPLLTLQR